MKNKKLLRILCALVLCAVVFTCMVGCRKKGGSDADTTGIGGVDVGEFKDIFDAQGNKIGQEVYYADGTLKYVENYNEKGEVIGYVLYNKDGTKSVEESRKYSGEGVVEQYVTVKYEYENGALTQYNQSFFNDRKWCTASYGYNADGSSQGFYTYGYDEAGNEIEKKEYGANMALRFIYETEYNEKNQPVKETVRKADGEISGYTLIEYNENGVISRRSECKPDGTVRNYCDYVYDNNGKLVEEQIFVSDGEGGFIRYN